MKFRSTVALLETINERKLDCQLFFGFTNTGAQATYNVDGV